MAKSVEELRNDISFYERQKRKGGLSSDEIRHFDYLIDAAKLEISNIENSREKRTTAENIGGTIGRIGGLAVSFFAGEIEACITGKTDESQVKNARARVANAGEKAGANIAGITEKLINRIRRR